MTDGLGARIGTAIGAERRRQGIGVSELARRAGVAKATVSQLEAGGGNPSVETLWAIAGALDVPFAALVESRAAAPTVIRAGDPPPAEVPSDDADYRVGLLSVSPPGARRDLYVVRAEPGTVKTSVPHPTGTVEHYVLQTGRARVGPVEGPIELGPGDYVSFAGDAPHVFEALEPGTSVVMIIEQR